MVQSLADSGDGDELVDRCAFDGQLTTDLPSMPLVYDMGTYLLIMWRISKSLTDQWTHMEQCLEDRSDEVELIDTKLGGVYSTDSLQHPSK